MRALLISIGILRLAASTSALADDLSRPLSASPDGHFLMDPQGAPFFYLGENAEFLLWKLDRDDADLYLRKRAEQGFTVIVADLLPKSDVSVPNAYGQRAFLGAIPDQPNPAYFQNVDWVISRAAHYGLRIALLPLNTYYITSGVFTATNVKGYGAWLAARYNSRGVIWVLGRDSDPVWAVGNLAAKDLVLRDYRPVFDQFAAALNSSGKAFITFHPPCCSLPGTAEPRTSLYLGNRPWLDMNEVQTSHFEDPTRFLKFSGLSFGWSAVRGYEPIVKEYESQPTRPIIDGEAHWEGVVRDPVGDGKEDLTKHWDSVDIRNGAYQEVFSGAAGHTYGHVSIFAFFKPGEPDAGSDFRKYANLPWKAALDTPASMQLHHLKNLMLSRPYFTRIPDQSVVVGDSLSGSEHIVGTRDRAGSYMMIYLPEGQEVAVDLLKIAGSSARAWWFDPRTGGAQLIGERIPTNHVMDFTPPSMGRGNDWVLVIDDQAEGFKAPGERTTGKGQTIADRPVGKPDR